MYAVAGDVPTNAPIEKASLVQEVFSETRLIRTSLPFHPSHQEYCHSRTHYARRCAERPPELPPSQASPRAQYHDQVFQGSVVVLFLFDGYVHTR
jgi:hypothetical protein